MIEFDFKQCGFKPAALMKEARKIAPYVSAVAARLKTHRYDFPESFMNLASDEKNLSAIRKLAREKTDRTVELIVVIGMGGSAIGTAAVYEALRPRRGMIFIDNIDPDALAETLAEIRRIYAGGKRCLYAVVTKSGNTLETIANFSVVLEFAKGINKDWRENFVFITQDGSPLHVYGLQERITVLTIAKDVSGRFSVFSAVGLFPLEAAGVDTVKLLKGAREMSRGSLAFSPRNGALMGAAAILLNYKKRRTLLNTFFFSSRLKRLGDFCAALIAESLGKGGRGMMPVTSIGASDLHSLGQRFIDGPDDAFTVFTDPGESDHDFEAAHMNLTELRTSRRLGFRNAMEAIAEGLIAAYRKAKRPFYRIRWQKVSEESLGAFMQMKMIETMYLGAMMKLNTFDQPAVEAYKRETRKILRG